MKYGFIGLGNMARAITQGMANSGNFEKGSILGFNRNVQTTEKLRDSIGLVPCANSAELMEKSDVVVLSVKPQVLPEIMDTVAAGCKGKLILSIAAGKTLSWYEERLPEGTPVIRIMPNINARVGASMSAICGNEFVTPEHMGIAKSIFSSVGKVYELNENMFPAFSAICGASGAFVLLYIDALAEAGVRAGFKRALAEEFAVGTVLGSALLKEKTGEHPIALMDSICSPGGTTIEGVLKLKELGFESAVQQGVNAIIEKDRKI